MNPIAIGCFALTIAVTLAVTVWAARHSSGRADYYAAGSRITGPQNGLGHRRRLHVGHHLPRHDRACIFDTGVDPGGHLLPRPAGRHVPDDAAGSPAPLRRAGKFTLGDVMTGRLRGPSLRLFAGISTIIISIIYLVGQLIGAGALISLLFGLPLLRCGHPGQRLDDRLRRRRRHAGGDLGADHQGRPLGRHRGWPSGVLCLIEGGGIGEIYRPRGRSPQAGRRPVRGQARRRPTCFSAVSLAFGMTHGHARPAAPVDPLLHRARRPRRPRPRRWWRPRSSAWSSWCCSAVVGPTAVALLSTPTMPQRGRRALAGGPSMVSIQLPPARSAGRCLMG